MEMLLENSGDLQSDWIIVLSCYEQGKLALIFNIGYS